jgi:LPXTG-motif cell wall-anchored protein
MHRVVSWLAAGTAVVAPLLVVVSVATPASAAGVTLLVSKSGTDAGDCRVNPCASVGYALSQAPSGATISVGAGTFHESVLVPTVPVTIEGTGAGSTTIDVSTANTSCQGTTYSKYAIYLVETGFCGTPMAAGAYTFSDLTLEGNGGATPADEPILVNVETVPTGSTVTFTHDDFVSNATVDPNFDEDFPVGLYAAGSPTTPAITITDDSFTGFYQAVFFEAFAGQGTVSGNTFALSPSEGYLPVGVYLLSDGSNLAVPLDSMDGPFLVSDNIFSNFDGTGVLGAAGLAGTSLNGNLSNVTITGNTLDLPAASNPGSTTLTSPIRLRSASTSGSDLSAVDITRNSISTSGTGAADIQVAGPTTPVTVSSVTILNNDLLGGREVVGVGNSSGAKIGAVGNWWGDPKGPSISGAGSSTGAPAGLDFARWCVTALPSCPSVPAAPSSATASDPADEATVSWTVPPTDGDQTITGYRITAHNQTTGATGPTVTVPTGPTSTTVTGLTGGDAYDFDVSAVNSVGAGAPAVTDVVTIETSPTTTTITTTTTTTTTIATPGSGSSGLLPQTGVDLGPQLAGAGGLLIVGTGLVLATRSRRRPRHRLRPASPKAH